MKQGEAAQEARAIARELAELGTRLSDLAQQFENLKSSSGELAFSNGTALLSASEVAERTGLSLAVVYRLAREGGLGAVRVGERGVRFSAAGLEAWLAGGRVHG